MSSVCQPVPTKRFKVKWQEKISNEELWQRIKSEHLSNHKQGKKMAVHYLTHNVQQKDIHWTGTLSAQGTGVDQKQPGKEQ
jgi:cytochrome c oxidase assembly protein Cox11